MQNVKIISGAYGYKPEGSSITKLIEHGAVISLPEQEADRLIKLGAAVSIDKPVKAVQEPETVEETPVQKKTVDKSKSKQKSEKAPKVTAANPI